MNVFNGRPVRRASLSEEPDPYVRMRSKLGKLLQKENNPNPVSGLPSPLDQLVGELEEFHEYYINKYSNLKGDYDALVQKLTASEQRFGLELERLCVALQQAEAERDRLREQRHRNDSYGGESLHRFYESLQQSIKESARADAQQLQDENRALQNKISTLTDEKAALQHKC